jgi:ADP-ribose pyrophosphatase YjhB (NUDIX family)
LPGGFLKVGEHPVDGLAREELEVEVEVSEPPVLLATHAYGPDVQYVLAIGFTAEIVGGDPDPSDDVAEVGLPRGVRRSGLRLGARPGGGQGVLQGI